MGNPEDQAAGRQHIPYKVAYDWEDQSGQTHTMEMPPYFISDIEAARINLREFSQNARSSYIQTILAGANPIVCHTFQAALAYTAFGQVSTGTETIGRTLANTIRE
jgi:hypothetical protein